MDEPSSTQPTNTETDLPETDQPEAHEFSSTQITLPNAIAKGLGAAAARIPDRLLAEKGREDDSHVTLKFGLHTADPEDVRDLLAGEPPIKLRMGKASIFPNGESDSGDVLKVDVESPDLHRLNQKLSDALEHTTTHPVYQPHATIAYLKPGEGAKYAGKPIPGVSGQEVSIDSVTFSSKSGEKTEIALAPAKAKWPAFAATKAPASSR